MYYLNNLLLFLSILFFSSSILLYVKFIKNRGLDLSYYSFIFYYYCIFAVVGSFFILSGAVDDFYFVQPIAQRIDLKYFGALLINASLFVFICVFLLLDLIFNVSYKKDMKIFLEKEAVQIGFGVELFVLFVFFTTSFYFLYTIWPSPFYLSLTGSGAIEIALRRNEVTESFSGIGFLKTLSIMSSNIVFCYSAFKILFERKFIYLFLLLLSSFVLLSTAEKSLIIFSVLSFIVFMYYRGGVGFVKIFTILALVFVLVLFMYFLFFEGDGFEQVFYLIFERVFIAQTIAVYLALDYYNIGNYLYFSSMDSMVFRLFGSEFDLRASEHLMEVYYPGMREMGSWNVNGIFLHEAYSNFGWFGIIFSMIYFPLINFLFVRVFFKIKKNIMVLCIFSYFTVSQTTLLTSFNYMLFNTANILFVIAFLLPILLIGKLKIK